MNRSDTLLSYRKSSIEGASPIGLVIALYDTLSGDLSRAAEALRNNDIEARCRQLNHATLVLGQLEDWIDLPNGGDLAVNLSTFYAYLRGRLLEAAITESPRLLEAQIELILEVRSAWQQRDIPQPAKNGIALSPAPAAARAAFSQSA